MFGTLAVCLPSEHQGGDLVLKHRNKTMSFKTSETLPSMACWFSDVSQAMLPVTSGLRIVLTYNLAVVEQSNAPLLSASTLRQHPVDLAAELAQTFRAWLDTRGSLPDMPDLTNWAHLFEKPNPDVELEYLCYVLDAIYTEKEAQYTPGDFASSMTKLNGPDRKKVEHLREMCDTQNATLFLGILDKHDVHFEPLEEYKDVGTLYYPQADWMSGYDDEPGYDPNWKPPFVIRNLIFLKGRQEVRRSMEIGKDHMKNTLVRCDNHNDLLDYRDKNFWKAVRSSFIYVHFRAHHLALTSNSLTAQMLTTPNNLDCRHRSQRHTRSLPNFEQLLRPRSAKTYPLLPSKVLRSRHGYGITQLRHRHDSTTGTEGLE